VGLDSAHSVQYVLVYINFNNYDVLIISVPFCVCVYFLFTSLYTALNCLHTVSCIVVCDCDCICVDDIALFCGK